MLGKSNDILPQTRDSFYDDADDNENATPRAPPLISSIRIVTSKPPIYHRQSQSSSSPSPSSGGSDRDVTDVSSLGGDHHQSQQMQRENHRQNSDHEQDHPFHLQSMRHVLLGSSAPTSRPPSPAHQQPPLIKKRVRIVTDDIDRTHRPHSSQHHHQPYIHGHTKDYRRVRLTSSAINRQKQQQKIERENLRLLDRLQHTRASHGLKRDELLTHYDHHVGYTTYPMPPIPARVRLPDRPVSAATMPSAFSTSERKVTSHSRPSSAAHTMNTNHPRSRPTSASTSVHGSSRSSSSRRPTWNDRWQQHE